MPSLPLNPLRSRPPLGDLTSYSALFKRSSYYDSYNSRRSTVSGAAIAIIIVIIVLLLVFCIGGVCCYSRTQRRRRERQAELARWHANNPNPAYGAPQYGAPQYGTPQYGNTTNPPAYGSGADAGLAQPDPAYTHHPTGGHDAGGYGVGNHHTSSGGM